MTSSEQPPGSESQNQDSEVHKAKKKAAGGKRKAPPEAKPAASGDLKKTSPQKSDKALSGPARSDVRAAAPRKKTPPPAPGRTARMAGIAVLAFAAGIIGGGLAAYVLLKNSAGLDQRAAAPAQAEALADIQQKLEGVRAEMAALRKRSDVLEGGLDDVRAQEPSQSGPEAAVFDELTDRVTGLEQALALMIAKGGQNAPSVEGAALAEVSAELRNLNRDLKALEGRVAARLGALEASAPPENLASILGALAPRKSVRDLESRISALESDRSGSDAKRAALGLGLASLIRAADRGEPFIAELETMALLAPGAADWKSLEPFAARGLRPSGALTAAFDEAARAALRAARGEGADTWWGRLWANIRSLVTIRRTGEVEGQSAQAIIARAEQRLKENNLRSAAQELRGLQGAAAASIAPWLGEVEGRLKLDDLVSSASAGLLSQLGSRDEAP